MYKILKISILFLSLGLRLHSHLHAAAANIIPGTSSTTDNLDRNIVTNSHPSNRIAYGFSAVEGQFPWQAALLIVSKSANGTANTVSVGGGTVISNEWVLTAGHCVSNAVVITITLGTVDRFKPVVRQWSTQFVLHPLYNPMTLNNDIGLIKLPEKLAFNGE